MRTYQTSVQLLGHATFKIVTPEKRVIILDPWLKDNPYIPAGLAAQPVIDLLLVTHGHEDHFDIRIKEIIAETSPVIIANNICRRFLIEEGVPEKCFEAMNLGGTVKVLDVEVTMVRAHHHAHVYVTESKIAFPHESNGFVLKMSDGLTIYFAGDTCVFGDMKLISAIYKPQFAVLPIGNRSMMGPLEAFHAVKLLKVPNIIPFHYGTFPAHEATADDFLRLTKNLKGIKIHLLRAGGQLDLGTA
jgi:L-ascorbate metabolism protein UlaG (beta-lactamase superfamily)